jgi:membrane-bound serine protease (ClpP class)
MKIRIVCLAFLLLLWAVVASSVTAAQSQTILLLEADGPVTPTLADYLRRGIDEAEEQGATAVLIVLDTPGGLLETTIEIVQLFRQSNVPVIVFVGPAGAQAASAGSVITMAAHAAAMAPETVIGAASPVGGDGTDIPETLYRKQVEDLKATVRGLTQRRGEAAVALAEAMIEDARAVHADEALEAGLIDLIVTDVPTLLAELDGQTVTVNDRAIVLQTAGATTVEFPMTMIERLLYALSNPTIVGLLLSFGSLALLIELYSPGGWVAGFTGIVCLGLGLYGAGQLPVNWLGLGLIVVAFVLFILEIKAATHGALAAAGIGTLVAGLLVLFNTPGTPEFARISIPSALAISLMTAAFFIFAISMALRANKQPPLTGKERLIGQVGTVRTPLTETAGKPPTYSGTILVMGELWRAAAEEPADSGEQVVVMAMEGFTLRVKKK